MLSSVDGAWTATVEDYDKIKACWTKVYEKDNYSVKLCFQDAGEVDATVVNFREAEGFGEIGLWQINKKLELLGFPGNGWPSASYLESCDFSFSSADMLKLEGCGLTGEWTKSKN